MNKQMKSPKNLILYKDFENGKLFYNMTWIMENYENDYYNKEDVESLLYESLNQLMELAVSHGFEGNLWHSFLAFILVNNENAYSKACEIRGEVEGSINQIVLHDFEIIKSLFDFDFEKLAAYFEMDCMDAMLNYQSMSESGKIFNKRIKERINELKLKLEAASNVSEFKDAVTAFYKDFGVGKLGLHKAFRIQHRENEDVEIVPITNIAHVKLEDLVGYELAKQKLIDNTEAFVNGKQANNCLLYGDAGTGKSTSIKAIANQYYDRGLRLIEVYKHQFCDLNDVIAQIKNRNYKFIIYMDDLSFEEFEIEYKYLKAVIEGGLEKKPDNVLIYATSNRRHLIRETFSDKEEVREDMHTSDTVQEKLSLYARFGVSIYFGAPSKKEFQNIVKVLAEKYQVHMDEETLLAEANKWELSHGGLSGRTAQQFINYLLGKE
jgi:predicted AAA+ superfamily ATPase